MSKLYTQPQVNTLLLQKPITYELPYVGSDQWVRLGYLLVQSNSGKCCTFEVISNSNTGYHHQALQVIFSTHSTGTFGSNGDQFKGICTSKFYHIELSFKVVQDNEIGSMFNFYCYMPAGHKSSITVSTNPNDSYTHGSYIGVSIPTWADANSIDSYNEKMYTANDIDGQLVLRQPIITTGSSTGADTIIGNQI